MRDWLHGGGHADTLLRIAERGTAGVVCMIGGRSEYWNIDLEQMVCHLFGAKITQLERHSELISFAGDRSGHKEGTMPLIALNSKSN